MTERRETRLTPNMRISYPVFEDEAMPAHAQEMNAFYQAFFDAVSAYAEEITASREGGIRILHADYKIREHDGITAVEYRIAVRKRGKTESAKTLTHVWRDGVLSLPQRRKGIFSRTYSKIRGRLTGRRE